MNGTGGGCCECGVDLCGLCLLLDCLRLRILVLLLWLCRCPLRCEGLLHAVRAVVLAVEANPLSLVLDLPRLEGHSEHETDGKTNEDVLQRVRTRPGTHIGSEAANSNGHLRGRGNEGEGKRE